MKTFQITTQHTDTAHYKKTLLCCTEPNTFSSPETSRLHNYTQESDEEREAKQLDGKIRIANFVAFTKKNWGGKKAIDYKNQ